MANPNVALVEDIVRLRERQDASVATLDRAQGRPPSLAELREINDTADRYSGLFKDLELPPPSPRAGDTPVGFRMRLLDALKPHSPAWSNASLLAAHAGRALDQVEREIVADASRVASDRTVGSFRRPGELRRIAAVDAGGRKSTEWAGSPLIWMQNFMPATVTCVRAFGDGRGNWYPRER
jgi:hypothetical protein